MQHLLPLAFGMPGTLEWVVIGVVALLLFGKRLPGVARSLGQAMHEFKAGLSGKVDDGVEEPEKPEKKDKTEDN